LKSGILIKNNFYTLETITADSNEFETWNEPEWGFPKGRRNYQEKDYECALREFEEETGFDIKNLKHVQNLFPFEEIFTGSNYKSYKHKYYLTYVSNKCAIDMDKFEPSEVSKMEWKTHDECIKCIRPYNLEKKRMITNINNMLKTYRILSF